jgi:adenylate cyclase class 2
MKEIELTILNINIQEVSQKLHALGAKKITQAFLIAESFDFPGDPLNQADAYLRLRQEGEKTVLTFKGKSEDSRYFKRRLEIETIVSDFPMTKKILLALGMHVIRHHEKKRTSWKWRSLRFDIDEFPTIPPYMEIEGPPEETKNILPKLGYSLDQTTKMSASQTLRWYGKNPNMQRWKSIKK